MTNERTRFPFSAARMLLAAAPLFGCQQGVILGGPRALNRPSSIAFACFDPERNPVPLDACRYTSDNSTVDGFHFIALVPGETRGEVAAVDLSEVVATPIDSDRRVPGFTFHAVGEAPSAIVTADALPDCAFVANRGSHSVQGIPVRIFRGEAVSVPAPVDLQSVPTRSSGRPEALVIDERMGAFSLYVTLPDDGALARLPIDPTTCALGAPFEIPIPSDAASLPEPPADRTIVEAANLDEAILGWCPRPASADVPDVARSLIADAPTLSAPIEPIADEDLLAPRPLQMVYDSFSDALLIGDQALPVVHRYALSTGTFEGSFLTDGPVRDLVATPPLPETFGGPPVRRYLYVVDDRDGTMMVLDMSTGQVLPVSATAARNPWRVSFQAPVQAIDVMQVDAPPDRQCSSGSPPPGPFTMVGTFVVAVLADGTMRFVDLYDQDASCRFGAACQRQANETWAFFRRHRPRIGSTINAEVQIQDAPAISVDGAVYRYDATGTVASQSAAPRLESTPCPAGLGRVFPNLASGSAESLICAVSDPWSAEPEQWSIVWEGAITNTASRSGSFAPLDGSDQLVLDTRMDACAEGVLGPEGTAGYAGDVIAITGAIPERAQTDDRPLCRALAQTDTFGNQTVYRVPIRQIRTRGEGFADLDGTPFETRFYVSGSDDLLEGPVFLGQPVKVSDLLGCLDQSLFSFDVRTRGTFAVNGSRTGFLHRVVRNPDLAGPGCIVDETASALRQGRASLGQPFFNGRLAFQLAYPEGAAPPVVPMLSIGFGLTSIPEPAAVDISNNGSAGPSLPVDVRWVGGQVQRLFSLESTRAGLAMYSVVPLTTRLQVQ